MKNANSYFKKIFEWIDGSDERFDDLLLDLVVVGLGALGPHIDPAPVSWDDHVLLEVGQAVVEAVLYVEIGRVSKDYQTVIIRIRIFGD